MNIREIQEEIGKQIKYYRKKLGLTLEELSFRTNLSISFIGEIERGKKSCSIKTLNRIAKVLNISLADLFDFTRKSDNKLLNKEIIQLINSVDEEDKQFIIKILRLLIKKLNQIKK